MLQAGERIDNHDKVCAEYYSTLLAMGAYDDEFAFFGTTYLEDGHRKAFISSNRLKVYEFVRECREKAIYPTPVENIVRRLRVNAGEKEMVGQQLKYDYAKKLNEKFSKQFLEELQYVSLCPINNRAEKILSSVRDNLEGCFDEDALLLFEGAVDFAYEGKILTSEEYYRNKAWLDIERDFLTDKIRKASNFKRKMTGFVYKKDGKVKYYSNAVEERTYEKRNELLRKGQRVTPVFTKEYYFNFFNELPGCLEDFDKVLRFRMDQNYLELIDDLYAIRPDINEHTINQLEKKVHEEYGSACVEVLNYYKVIWHFQ